MTVGGICILPKNRLIAIPDNKKEDGDRKNKEQPDVQVIETVA